MTTGELEMHRLRDERTRSLIREQLGETMFVEAGAGTGKTRALVDRYVAHILAGARVDEILAITFTEKAAAELRDRVRGELERRAEAGDGDATVLQTALASLDRAQVSTIHAFALNVLRSFAAEQGIDPSFGVHDEVLAERRFQERWRSFLEDAGRDADVRDAVSRALALGLATRDIEKLAHELWRNGAVSEMLAKTPLPVQPAQPVDLEGLRATLLAFGFHHVPAEDNLRIAVERALEALDTLIEAPPEQRDSLLAALAPTLKSGQMGSAPNWGGKDAIEPVRDALKIACDSLASALAATRSEVLGRLAPVALRFVTEETRARLRDGDLLFDDLILQLRNILRDNPDARRRLRATYRTLLIDEFQDTDPLQVDIAEAFARDPDTGELEAGRLFLVGDPKQSIYRFRRADMGVYAATRSLVLQHLGQVELLALNRRSRREVLQFVNTTFEALIGDGGQPSVQPPYRPVHAERDESLAGPGVAWTGRVLNVAAREARRHEAQQVAARCRDVLEQGWEVWERDESVTRPARYRDIAILVPTRTILQPLERALAAAGVPYRVEGGSLIYATQEVRDLINFLSAIDDSTDDVAVVATLRSPAYACSDVDLARHRLAGGSFNYLAPGLDAAAGPVAAGLIDLHDWHLDRNNGSLARLIERFVARHRAVEAGLYDAGNRNAYRRARFVIEQARAFEAGGPESLRAFIDWLERRAREAILDHEGAGLDDDEDAVRVLTIHAAKGLEFPIVFIAGLGISPANQTSVIGLDRTQRQVALAIGSKTRGANFSAGPMEEIAIQEKAHERAERDRLLYVAATRARDHLVLFLYRHAKAHNTFAQRLFEAGAGVAAVELPELPPAVNAGLGPFAALEVEAAGVADDAFDALRDALIAGAAPPLVTSATGLGRLDDEGKEREDESEPWARGRAGTHRGRAVHAALQVLPWDADDATIDALARAQAVAEAVPEEGGRIAELLRRALATDAAGRTRTARRASREMPFAFVQDGITLEGFADLVLETDDGLEIVDWKTDAVPASAVPERLRGYELQAGLYVLGLEEATGRRVTRVTYVFVDPGREASPGDPTQLAQAARERLRALLNA